MLTGSALVPFTNAYLCQAEQLEEVGLPDSSSLEDGGAKPMFQNDRRTR